MGTEQKARGERRMSRQREAGEATRRETRRRLLVAAGHEFAERGYVAATVTRIAERAGVSLQTLYSAWGNKRELLRAVMLTAITGEAEPDPRIVAGQPPQALLDEMNRSDPTDAAAYLGLLAHQFRRLSERSAVGFQTYRDASAVDPEIAADWRQLMEVRRTSFAAVVARIPAAALREGLSRSVAADTAWVIASPDTHDMLVRLAGYSYDELEAWVATTLRSALLRD